MEYFEEQKNKAKERMEYLKDKSYNIIMNSLFHFVLIKKFKKSITMGK